MAFSWINIEIGQKKTAIAGGFLESWFGLFYSSAYRFSTADGLE
ncbi:hypothetical protein ACFQAT_19940 [Undibacterium arcticum]|uniref:Uncharacterized protein n=1 Tax=Undibacterium arcticum TaxID=1762892 RepID=A0ABV7F2M6_9BURK